VEFLEESFARPRLNKDLGDNSDRKWIGDDDDDGVAWVAPVFLHFVHSQRESGEQNPMPVSNTHTHTHTSTPG
jgi:hypothetical protein